MQIRKKEYQILLKLLGQSALVITSKTQKQIAIATVEINSS